MYKITHDADSIARQVVPQDFSFLSDADVQIVKALELIVSMGFGVDVSKPVLLGNRVITRRITPDGSKFTFGANMLLWQGRLYDLPASSETLAASESEFLRSTYVIPLETTVAPSPVYGVNEVRDVNVHKSLNFGYQRSADGSNEWTLAELSMLPILSVE